MEIDRGSVSFCLSDISNKSCFFPVIVNNENLTTKPETEQHPIPSSLVHVTDRDKIKLELILIECGLDFGLLTKAEKEAMKKELNMASSDSIEEKLCPKCEKDWKDLESFE